MKDPVCTICGKPLLEDFEYWYCVPCKQSFTVDKDNIAHYKPPKLCPNCHFPLRDEKSRRYCTRCDIHFTTSTKSNRLNGRKRYLISRLRRVAKLDEQVIADVLNISLDKLRKLEKQCF